MTTIDTLGLGEKAKKPASNPIFTPPAGLQTKPAAANPNVEMIGGIPHMKLQDQKFPGPLGIMAGAYAGTVAHAASAPFDRNDQMAKIRAGLDSSEEVRKEQQRQSVVSPQNPQPHVIVPAKPKDAGLMPSDRHNTGTMVDMAADNKAMAAANATRQQMVDMQPKGGAGILRDTAADAWNARMDKDSQVQKITDMMARNPNMAGALSGALNQTVAGQTQQDVEQMRQQGIMAGVDTQRRGQDIAAKNESARLAGNPMDNSLKQQQVIAAQGANDRQAKLDGILAGIGNEKDPAKRSALMEQYLIASGKSGDKRYLSVQGGEEFVADGTKIKRPDSVFDTVTRQAIPLQQQARPATAAASVPDPGKLEVGKTYMTSKGPMVWRGNGWEAAQKATGEFQTTQGAAK